LSRKRKKKEEETGRECCFFWYGMACQSRTQTDKFHLAPHAHLTWIVAFLRIRDVYRLASTSRKVHRAILDQGNTIMTLHDVVRIPWTIARLAYRIGHESGHFPFPQDASSEDPHLVARELYQGFQVSPPPPSSYSYTLLQKSKTQFAWYQTLFRTFVVLHAKPAVKYLYSRGCSVRNCDFMERFPHVRRILLLGTECDVFPCLIHRCYYHRSKIDTCPCCGFQSCSWDTLSCETCRRIICPNVYCSQRREWPFASCNHCSVKCCPRGCKRRVTDQAKRRIAKHERSLQRWKRLRIQPHRRAKSHGGRGSGGAPIGARGGKRKGLTCTSRKGKK
jgi:hypothetical protein